MQMHDDSIPRGNTTYIGKTDGTPLFSTSTDYALPTCEAKPDGVACWHHAEIPYITSEGVTKMLCKQCYTRMWEIILTLHKARVETLDAEERGVA